jgi:hypothetical protein
MHKNQCGSGSGMSKADSQSIYPDPLLGRIGYVEGRLCELANRISHFRQASTGCGLY